MVGAAESVSQAAVSDHGGGHSVICSGHRAFQFLPIFRSWFTSVPRSSVIAPYPFPKFFSHISLVSVLCLHQRASCLHLRALMGSLAVFLLLSLHIHCCSQCPAPQSLWRWQAGHPLLPQTSLSFMEPTTREVGVHCQFRRSLPCLPKK